MSATPFYTLSRKPTWHKLSSPRIDMSDNEDSWEQEARDAFIAEHPWASKLTVRVRITKTHPAGYAVGQLQLTPAFVPATATGPSKINLVSVPIIIEDGKLYAFDYMHHKGNYYPLTESKAMQILRVPDVFAPSDRSAREIEMASRRYDNEKSTDPLQRRNIEASFGSGYPFKFSSGARTAADQVKLELVSALMTSDIEGLHKKSGAMLSFGYSSATREQLDALTGRVGELRAVMHKLSGVKRTKVKLPEDATELPESISFAEHASLCLSEIEKRSDAFYIRGYWASRPSDGKAGPSGWSKTSYAKLTKAYGDKVVKAVLDNGWTLVKESGFDARSSLKSALRNLGNAQVQQRLQAMSLADGHNKTSKAYDAALFIRKGEDRGSLLLPERFKAKPIRGLVTGGSKETVGVLLDGHAYIMQSPWEFTRVHSVVPLRDESVPAANGGYSMIYASGTPDTEDVADRAWIYHDSDDNHCYLVLGRYRGLEDGSGKRKLELMHWSNDMLLAEGTDKCPTYIEPTSSFARITIQKYEDHKVVYLPQAGLTPVELKDPPQSKGISLEDKTEEVGGAPERVTIEKSSRGFYVKCSTAQRMLGVSDQDDLNERQAIVALATCGLKLSEAKVALDALEEVPAISFTVSNLPVLDEGLSIVEEVRQKVSRAQPVARRMLRAHDPTPLVDGAERLLRAALSSNKLTKKSAIMLGSTVDSMLSLGFLNRRNLMKFVDMRPLFEEALSKLCALGVACRLGLTDVPCEDVDAAVKALDPVVSSLRALEMNLRATA